ncbi:type VI secretion system TssO [Kaistella jeonii]|uniref:type VI secretion system TssO n=1 Tax=Kaistella jeonii TaxID=266749 RepID=UPI0008DEDFFC|nr:type VI secretion system TssO [Kaistella jeonii]SFC41965.1 hypothetical protein SAMN05421876_12021 [Kaistella jeonii]VEI97341.1 Uncharacterised protein [Kaistella jeonii]
MISSGQKRLNRDDVQKGTRNFILSFIILCAMAFCTVFLFFKSAEMQNKEIRSDLNAYHDMLGRNELLNIKLDTIYEKMSQMSSDRVSNDMFLRNSIIQDIQVGNQLIAEDSVADLKQISILLKQMQPMLTYKNELLKKKMEKTSISRLLNECMGNDGRVTEGIKKKNKPKGKLY